MHNIICFAMCGTSIFDLVKTQTERGLAIRFLFSPQKWDYIQRRSGVDDIGVYIEGPFATSGKRAFPLVDNERDTKVVQSLKV